MDKPWNQCQGRKRRGVLITFGILLLLLASESHDAVGMNLGGGPATAIEQAKQIDFGSPHVMY